MRVSRRFRCTCPKTCLCKCLHISHRIELAGITTGGTEVEQIQGPRRQLCADMYRHLYRHAHRHASSHVGRHRSGHIPHTIPTLLLGRLRRASKSPSPGRHRRRCRYRANLEQHRGCRDDGAEVDDRQRPTPATVWKQCRRTSSGVHVYTHVTYLSISTCGHTCLHTCPYPALSIRMSIYTCVLVCPHTCAHTCAHTHLLWMTLCLCEMHEHVRCHRPHLCTTHVDRHALRRGFDMRIEISIRTFAVTRPRLCANGSRHVHRHVESTWR